MILSNHDLRLLASADNRIQQFVTKLAQVSTIPFMVTETSRSFAAQQAAYDSGHSHALPGQSPHDFTPSLAVDLAPLPVNWQNVQPFEELAHYAKIASTVIGIPITWGGTFPHLVDMPHFELSDWKAIVAAAYDHATGMLKGATDAIS